MRDLVCILLVYSGLTGTGGGSSSSSSSESDFEASDKISESVSDSDFCRSFPRVAMRLGNATKKTKIFAIENSTIENSTIDNSTIEENRNFSEKNPKFRYCQKKFLRSFSVRVKPNAHPALFWCAPERWAVYNLFEPVQYSGQFHFLVLNLEHLQFHFFRHSDLSCLGVKIYPHSNHYSILHKILKPKIRK